MDADKKRIWIRGQFVEVTDEVYRAYMQGDRKMRYFENDLKTERFVLGKEGQVVQIIPSREDSLDRLVDENAQQFSDEQESVESVVLHKLEVDRLHTALSLLAPEERALIQALFFEEKTERQYADELGVYRNAVHVRKMKVLKKLRALLEGSIEKPCLSQRTHKYGKIPDPATPVGPGILLVGAYPQTPVFIQQVYNLPFQDR